MTPDQELAQANLHRVNKLTRVENIERLARIRRVSDRMTYHPDDSLLDAEAPRRERHDPQGWNYRHG